jgi:hypothetical protein
MIRLRALGYGWCLEQSGDRRGAIVAYRAVLKQTWPLEKTKALGMDLRGTITEEAIDYLIPLLDAKGDKEEIARLRGYLADGSHAPRAIHSDRCAIERVAARASVGRVESSHEIRRRRQRT